MAFICAYAQGPPGDQSSQAFSKTGMNDHAILSELSEISKLDYLHWASSVAADMEQVTYQSQRDVPLVQGSVDAIKHAAGCCSPCRLFFSSSGCPLGRKCNFCHLPHIGTEVASKKRLCKGKRDRLSRQFARVVDKIEHQPFYVNASNIEIVLLSSLQVGRSHKSLLMSRLERFTKQARKERLANVCFAKAIEDIANDIDASGYPSGMAASEIACQMVQDQAGSKLGEHVIEFQY